MKKISCLFILLLSTVFVISCEEDDETQLCQKIEQVSGNNQVGVEGQALPQPLKVRVTDENNVPKSGVNVHWTVTSGQGTVTPSTTVTNNLGESEANWTLGAGQGAQQAAAQIDPTGESCTAPTSVNFTTEPAAISLSGAEILSDNANSGCSKPTDEGYEITILYTANLDLSNYYVEVVTDWTASNGQQGSFGGGIGKEVTAEEIVKYNCFTYGSAVWIDQVFQVRIYSRNIAGQKTGPVLAESNHIGPYRIEKPEPTQPTFSISKVSATVKELNSSSCSNGGSLYEYSIEYITNTALDIYYVEVIMDGSFSPSGATFNFAQPAYGIENSLARVLAGGCFIFNDDVSVNKFFAVKLYQKNENGEKYGPALVTSNRFGPLSLSKPSGGARISISDAEQPGNLTAILVPVLSTPTINQPGIASGNSGKVFFYQ